MLTSLIVLRAIERFNSCSETQNIIFIDSDINDVGCYNLYELGVNECASIAQFIQEELSRED